MRIRVAPNLYKPITMNSIYTLFTVTALSCLSSADDLMMNKTLDEMMSKEAMTTEMNMMPKEEMTAMPPTMHSSFITNSSYDPMNIQPPSNSFDVGSSSLNVETGPSQGSDFQPSNSNWAPSSSGEVVQHQIGNFSNQEQDKHRYEVVTNSPSSTTNMFDMMHGDDPMMNHQGPGSQWGSDNQNHNNMNHPMMPTTEGKMDDNKNSVGSWKEVEMGDHEQHGQNGTATSRMAVTSLIVLSTVLSSALYRLNVELIS